MSDSILTMDFGTSNTLVGAVINGQSHEALPLDPNAKDPTVIRTLLFFPHENEAYYGNDAIAQYTENAFEGRFIKSIKKFLPQESYLGSHIENRVVRLEDLISFFLLEMKKRAEKHLDTNFDSIVLGRPAKYSHDTSKDNIALYRMKKAAELAGFKNIDFLQEPVAAAYDFKNNLDSEKIVLVVDLGGGTSDFTIAKMSKHKFSRDDVLAMSGVPVAGDKYDGSIMKNKLAPQLGSEVSYKVPLGSNVLKMPSALLEHICSPGDLTQLRKKDFFEFFKQIKNWNVSDENKVFLENLEVIVDENLGFNLFQCIDNAKVDLNKTGFAGIVYEYADILLKEKVSIEEFNEFSSSFTNSIFDELNHCLSLAQLKPQQIDYIHCTGGTSKLKIIQSELARMFDSDKIQAGKEFHSVLFGLNEYAMDLNS